MSGMSYINATRLYVCCMHACTIRVCVDGVEWACSSLKGVGMGGVGCRRRAQPVKSMNDGGLAVSHGRPVAPRGVESPRGWPGLPIASATSRATSRATRKDPRRPSGPLAGR